MLFRLTINDVEVSNADILDKVEFITDFGAEEFVVGKLIVPTAKIKLHEDVNIKIGDVVKIYLDDAIYGTYEPYEIKQGIMSREVILYAMPYFALTKTFQPTKTEYTTRSLLLEMQTAIGFNIVDFEDIVAIDMKNVKADTGVNLLQAIAMILGVNCFITEYGEILFKLIGNNTARYTVTTRNGEYIQTLANEDLIVIDTDIHQVAQSQITKITKMDTTDYLITRIIGKLSDNDENPIIVGTQANSWNDLTLTNPYLTESICSNILATLPHYTGFELTIFNAPLFRPLDKIVFTYKDKEYTIPIMNLTLTFSVGGLVAKVQSCVSNAQDKASNYKGSLTTKLEVIKNVQSELNTKVEVVDGKVSSLITRTDVIEGDVTTVKDQYSQINQTVGEIDLKVGQVETQLGDKVSTDEIITSINLSNEGVKIQGDKVVLTGDTIIIGANGEQTITQFIKDEGENLLLKPNFNDGSLTNWNYSVSRYLSIDTSRKHEDSTSLKLNYTGSSNAVMIATSAMSITKYEAGRTYKASMWIYVEDKTKLKGNLVFSASGVPAGSTSSTIIDSITLTSTNLVNNKWIQFTFDFVPTVDHTSPTIRINCSSGVVAWVTDFTLQEQGGMSQQQMVDILNGAGDGLYLVDGELLMNAEYIQTGTLRADLIRVQTDEQTANLLPFNYVTLTNAINTDSFGVMSQNTANVYLTIDLPIPYGGTTEDTLTTPIGYSKVTLKKGHSYWFVCEYLARWISDRKYEDGVGVSTATTGSKYGIGTGNNMDILLYPSLDRRGFNEGRNLLNNTDGRGVPVAFLGQYISSGFSLSTNSTYGHFTLSSGNDSSTEQYFRFMHPNPTNRYGFDSDATYTFSGYVRGTKEEISIRWEGSTDGVNWNVGDVHPIGIVSDTKDVYFEYTFTIPSQVRGFYIGFQAYGDNTASGTTAVFSKLKLEKSTKATPWCLSPADQGYANPTTIEESKPSYTLASVYDFNASVKVDANAIYGRNWTTLISRIDCEHDFTGYLWLNLDGSGFPNQDSGYFHIRRMQLTYAEDSDAPIVLDYLKQINEKKFTLTDGAYFTNTIGIDGIRMQEGNISMTSESSESSVNINYDSIELKCTQSNEYQYLAMGDNTFHYTASGVGGSSVIIEDKSCGFVASARNPSTKLIDGIFTGIHYGYNFIDKNGATVYGRPDIYRHTNKWDKWELLGEKIEPLGLVRRDDYSNITTQSCLCIAHSTNTNGETYNGATVFSEAMYNAVGNGQLINVNPSDNRIYVGNPNSILLLESAYGLTVNEAGEQKQVLTNGTQYGHPQVNIYTGSSIEIWADSDSSTTTEYVWLGAGKNAITITSSGAGQSNTNVKYNGNPMYHEGNVYQTLDNAYSGRDVGSAQGLRKIHSYNLYNKSLLNGDGTSSAYGGYWSVLHWGNGANGSAELAIDWTSKGRGFYMRSLRDTQDNWFNWKRIGNSEWILDSTSDERYKRAISDVSTEDCYNMVRNIELHSYLLLTEEERYRVEKGELDADELFLRTVASEGIHHNLQMGVLAQDMLKYSCGTYVVNQDVLRDENGELISDRYGIDAYNYASAILGGLQEEIKIRDKQYEELKQENEELKVKNQELEKRLAHIEAMLLQEPNKSEYDLNNYRELQIYCKELKEEIEELTPAKQVEITVEIEKELTSKGHVVNNLPYCLKLNNSKQYLQDWVTVVERVL